MSGSDKRSMQRAIFANCRSRGIDEDARRALQLRVTGKASMKDMTADETARLLKAVRGGDAPGWTGPERLERGAEDGTKHLPGGPHDAKLLALWISGWNLGVVREPGAEALASWICRQTGLSSAKWARPKDTAACIEALKDWLAREGGVDWSPYDPHPGHDRPRDNPRARVIEAIWKRIHERDSRGDRTRAGIQAWTWRCLPGGMSYLDAPAREQDRLIRKLGLWLRECGG